MLQQVWKFLKSIHNNALVKYKFVLSWKFVTFEQDREVLCLWLVIQTLLRNCLHGKQDEIRIGTGDAHGGKHTIFSLYCVSIKPVRFSFCPGKVKSLLKQSRSWQRRDKNLHINALCRDDFERLLLCH